MKLAIRRARTDDLSGIQRAIANSWREGYGDLLPAETLHELTDSPAEFYPKDRYHDKLSDDRLLYLVALSDDEVAGIVNCCWGDANTHDFVDPGDCQVRSLYLDPQYWRQGIGTALLNESADRLPPTLDTLIVEVLSQNYRGCAFYESVGFEPVSTGTIELYGGSFDTQIYRREKTRGCQG